jgi:hypothetical protein
MRTCFHIRILYLMFTVYWVVVEKIRLLGSLWLKLILLYKPSMECARTNSLTNDSPVLSSERAPHVDKTETVIQ